STITILSQAVASRAGMSPDGSAPQITARLVGGQPITMPIARARSIAIGDLTVENVDVGLYEALPHLPGLDGLLGSDVLRHFAVSLDRAARRLTLEIARPAAARRATVEPSSPPRTPPSSAAVSASAPQAPVWHVGDEWAFRWESPRGS